MPLCTLCDTGKWHNRFERFKAEDKGYVSDGHGFLQPEGGWDKPQD